MSLSQIKLEKDEIIQSFGSTYQIHEELGKGQFGYVYRATKLETNEIFAIKSVDIESLQAGFKKEKLTQLIEFEKNQLKPKISENVLRTIDSFVHREKRVQLIVLEYCEGGDLYGFLSEQPKKRFMILEAMKIFKQIITGLHALHTMDIIHRDIKLENILLKGKVIQIADFGFARTIDPDVQEYAQSNLGTGPYMAPEIGQEQYDFQVDVYSAGIILYQLIFGIEGKYKYPFKNDHEKKKKKINFDELEPHISTNLKNLLEGMLKPKPGERMDIADIWEHPVWHEFELQKEEVKNDEEKEKDKAETFNVDELNNLAKEYSKIAKNIHKDIVIPNIQELNENKEEEKDNQEKLTPEIIQSYRINFFSTISIFKYIFDQREIIAGLGISSVELQYFIIKRVQILHDTYQQLSFQTIEELKETQQFLKLQKLLNDEEEFVENKFRQITDALKKMENYKDEQYLTNSQMLKSSIVITINIINYLEKQINQESIDDEKDKILQNVILYANMFLYREKVYKITEQLKQIKIY